MLQFLLLKLKIDIKYIQELFWEFGKINTNIDNKINIGWSEMKYITKLIYMC